jgi:hypothetical protein
MRIAHAVAISLAVLAGPAMAQELTTVEVQAEEDAEKTMTVSCVDPAEPSLSDVGRVLSLSDPAKAEPLRGKLMAAAAEACAKNEPKISVSRTANNKVTWKAKKDEAAN